MANNNKTNVFRKIMHKIIIVDFIINIVFLVGALIYAYQVVCVFDNSREFMLSASLILIFIAVVFFAYDIAYFYQCRKGQDEVYMGMSRIMAVASVSAKVLVLLVALLGVIFAGPEKFLLFFQAFF